MFRPLSFQNTVSFFVIAHQCYVRSREVLARAVGDDFAGHQAQAQALNLAYAAIVFSAFTLESAINVYGRQRLGEAKFKSTERNLSVKKKFEQWSTSPDDPETKFREVAVLSALMDRRDGLAHDKPYLTEEGPADTGQFMARLNAWSDHINDSVFSRYLDFDPIDAVRVVMRDLKRVDPSVDVGWVDQPLAARPFWDLPAMP